MHTSSADVHQRLVTQAKQDIMSGVIQETHNSPKGILPTHLISHACRLAAEGRLPYDVISEALTDMLTARGYLQE